MLKLMGIASLGLAALLASAGAQAAALGPDPAACAAEAGRPAALVRVVGFKNRAGTVRVRAFPIGTRYLFDKRGVVERVEVRTPAGGPADICVPLPGPGAFAFDVRHDADGDGDTGMKDGGGMSGNPHYSLWQAITKTKPPVDKVTVRVGRGVTVVPVVLNYVQGGSFGPLDKTAAR